MYHQIDLTMHEENLKRSAMRARERKIRIPTFRQMKDPDAFTPRAVKEGLKTTGLWDVDPLNLFRITWKNEPKSSGGLYGGVNFIEFPSELTGVKARIFGLVGKWFPTGAHKVGASFGCLVPRLITGQFDPTRDWAVWPSTGNYCRGGAYNSQLLGCRSIAILPEGMSRERFEWLETVAGEIIATPGMESNVKEIYDKVAELRATRDDVMIFNQFEEMGNYLWHYEVTGSALEEVAKAAMRPGDRVSAAVYTTGSAGTIASGDRLKQLWPAMKIVASEALQCPTLLRNGWGAHRIEGIGDKHVPWVHNVRNTDMVTAIDDADCMALIRLFNEPAGREYLRSAGVSSEMTEQLGLLGISGATNLLSSIKTAKYYEMDEHDMVFTILTDSMEMYGSRLKELEEEQGAYTAVSAAVDFCGRLAGQKTDNMAELSYYDKKRIHDLKYYTWIEQQGKTSEELHNQWYDADNYWGEVRSMAPKIDALIDQFNTAVGLD
ncbi:MAG: pyridoxal-phosphate dependent enzyme [Pyramidobacter sp.]|nr:pyridoxal-phosphate dependent enzyme [Pyramidobacter sp.]